MRLLPLLILTVWTGLTSFVLHRELVKRSFFEDSMQILMPSDFKLMDEELIKVKYPGPNRPTIIYTDESTTVNMAFNHVQARMTPDQLPQFHEFLQQQFKQAYPEATWHTKGIKEINGKQVGYFEVTTPGLDQPVRNLIFMTSLKEQLLLCTFNCVEKTYGDWQKDAQTIMNSLEIR